MARTLTTPETQPDAVQQAITGFNINVPHTRNAGNTAMELNKLRILVTYNVVTYDPDGEVIETVQRGIPFQIYDGNEDVTNTIWPAGFVTAVRDVYDRLHADAENEGLIVGPGTDEPIE